jgi:hypothetical protein
VPPPPRGGGGAPRGPPPQGAPPPPPPPPPPHPPPPPPSPHPASEATLSLSYPVDAEQLKCFRLQQWNDCAAAETFLMEKASEAVRLPNEYVAWIRAHKGMLKGMIALNKALDPKYKFKPPPAGKC